MEKKEFYKINVDWNLDNYLKEAIVDGINKAEEEYKLAYTKAYKEILQQKRNYLADILVQIEAHADLNDWQK